MPVSKEWDFQKTFLRRTYNREVNEFFRDIDDEVLEEINVPRKAAKRACLILPNDTLTIAIHKQLTFRFVCQRAHDAVSIMGVPKDMYDMEFRYKPHVQLFFRQDLDAVPDGFRPIEGEISFRLIGETSNSITVTKLTQVANRIKLEFGQNGGYLWKKGKSNYCYKDVENGLDLRIYALNETEGKEVIGKICSVVQCAYDNDLLRVSTPEKNSLNTPTTQTILTEVIKKPRWRPTANVRFHKASCIVHGRPKPVILLDLWGRSLNALVV